MLPQRPLQPVFLHSRRRRGPQHVHAQAAKTPCGAVKGARRVHGLQGEKKVRPDTAGHAPPPSMHQVGAEQGAAGNAW